MRSIPTQKVTQEIKKVVTRVKAAQGQLEALIKNQSWIDEARRYAERQGKEVQKMIQGDVVKVRDFLEKERKELDRFQKQIPSEVKKFRKFVLSQRKELEQLLQNVKKVAKTADAPQKSASKKGTKSVSRSKSKPGTSRKVRASAVDVSQMSRDRAGQNSGPADVHSPNSGSQSGSAVDQSSGSSSA